MTAPAPRMPGDRSVLVLVTVPASMVQDDLPTLIAKFHRSSAQLVAIVAGEVHRALRDPDMSPELVIARVTAELKARERDEPREERGGARVE